MSPPDIELDDGLDDADCGEYERDDGRGRDRDLVAGPVSDHDQLRFLPGFGDLKNTQLQEIMKSSDVYFSVGDEP